MGESWEEGRGCAPWAASPDGRWLSSGESRAAHKVAPSPPLAPLPVSCRGEQDEGGADEGGAGAGASLFGFGLGGAAAAGAAGKGLHGAGGAEAGGEDESGAGAEK